MRFLTLPNAVSLARLPLAAAFPLADGVIPRLALFGAAALSDWADGRLARRSDSATPAGALLDPVTDRVFVVAVLATFLAQGTLRPTHLALLLLRDAFTTVAFLVAAPLGLRLEFRARLPGKVVTGLQMGALLALLLAPGAVPALAWGVAAVSVVAVADYAREALPVLRGRRDRRRAEDP